jgi:DNA-binding response OmpR family regulator
MRPSILIVDDDAALLRTVQRMLEYANYDTITVNSGKACILELEKGFKGLILMDIIMPVMDGWDTIREIVSKGLHEGVLICMLTGKDEPDEKMNPLKEYVLDYIRKPIDQKIFLDIIKGYLEYLE